MVDDTNPYAVTASADQASHPSVATDRPVRWLNLIGWLHAVFGTWGLASSVLLLIGQYPRIGTGSGFLLASLIPSVLLSAIGILGGLLLSRRHPAGWWLIGSLSACMVISQLMVAYLFLGSGMTGSISAQSLKSIGLFAIFRGCLGLAVLGYLSQTAVQRVCQVRAAGRAVNLFLLVLGGIALTLVVTAIRLL